MVWYYSIKLIRILDDESDPGFKYERVEDEFEDRVISLSDIEDGIPPLLRIVLRLTTHQISALYDILSTVIDTNNKECLQ